jgi:predicted O-methyltransferase YrrM
MTWQDYLASIDDSHQMTTAREHIAELCRLVEGRELRILELGSHAGISTAALAIAAPESTIVSVDLCDTIPEETRVEYWSLLGIENIQPVRDDAGRFLRQSQLGLDDWDLIFHDAVHGEAAWHEYLTASGICRMLAIHDWEQLGETSRESVRSRFAGWQESMDDRGRFLFLGFHHD